MNNQTTPHRSSTDTMGREQNLAETLTSEPTQACVDTNAPLLSAAFCSALDSTVDVEGEGLDYQAMITRGVAAKEKFLRGEKLKSHEIGSFKMFYPVTKFRCAVEDLSECQSMDNDSFQREFIRLISPLAREVLPLLVQHVQLHEEVFRVHTPHPK